MTTLGAVESLLLLCICGFILLGLAGLGLIVWFLTSERRNANASDHGALGGLGNDDHPQYLTAARASSFISGGDHDHSLVDLQDVVADEPREGQVLTHTGGRWQAHDLQVRGGVPHFRQLVTVRRESPRLYEFWFTPDTPGNQAEIIELPVAALQVFRETESRPKFLTRITVESVERIRRNVFRVSLRQESEFLRFAFDLLKLPLSNERNLRSYAQENGLNFLGQGGDQTVTVHFRLTRDV
jgi:hypothetical protein